MKQSYKALIGWIIIVFIAAIFMSILQPKTLRCRVPYTIEYCKSHQFEMRDAPVWSEL